MTEKHKKFLEKLNIVPDNIQLHLDMPDVLIQLCFKAPEMFCAITEDVSGIREYYVCPPYEKSAHGKKWIPIIEEITKKPWKKVVEIWEECEG
jgi:hypothetical protein